MAQVQSPEPLHHTLIKHYEQCRLKPYLCPAGIPTIGWGSTYYEDGTAVTLKDPEITVERAQRLFAQTVRQFENDVRALVKRPMTDGQFGALVSFAFNVGSDIDTDLIAEGLGDSTLLRLFNLRLDDKATLEFSKWTKGRVKGVLQVLNGLVKRRAAEATLFSTGRLILQ